MKKKTIPEQASDQQLELLFRHAGLSEKQAKLYRILLSDGQQKASVLARRSGIKRSNAYALLKDMVIRGLVTQFDRGHIIYFRPESPQKLLDILEAREKDISLGKNLASTMLPKLTNQWKTAINRPTIQYFEGEEGIQKVFMDIYAPKKEEVWGCVDLEEADAVFPKHIIKNYIPLRIKNKLKAISFIADSPQARIIHQKDQEQLRESILLDKKEYPLPAEIDVYEDKIAMLTFEKGAFVGLIIQNQKLATTLKSIFKQSFLRPKSDQQSGAVLPLSGI